MLTIEGIKIQAVYEALAQGEGFIVRLFTHWNDPDNEFEDAIREAQSRGIIGQRLNAHEPTYADAKTRMTVAMDAFETEVTAFITEWNNQ